MTYKFYTKFGSHMLTNHNIQIGLPIVFLCSILLFCNMTIAQVTIGNGETPAKGAILQLKENETINGANSSKGLGLPRVALTPSITNDLGESLKLPIGTLNSLDHLGMLVYNVEENTTYCPGLHVWEGGLWIPLQEQGVGFFTDIRTKGDGSKETVVYPYRTFGEAGTWMLTSLRATTYADNLGVDKPTKDIKIGKNTTNSKTELLAYYPGAKTTSTLEEDKARFSKNTEYGMIYTWAAATNGKVILPHSDTESTQNDGEANDPSNVELVGVQGICPTGWHLPSDKEWNDLEKAIANEQTGEYTLDNYKSDPWSEDWRYDRSTYRNNSQGHGTSMKSPLVSNYQGKSRVCGKGGFNAFATGLYSNTDYNYYGTLIYFWTSSYIYNSSNSYSPMDRRLSFAHSGVGRYGLEASTLTSVRCKKN